MTSPSADPDTRLPLSEAEFHILLALSAGDRHGYGIMKDVEAFTRGAVRLSPGTLYRTIQRLLDEGLISEAGAAPGMDPRQRPYRITAVGSALATAESKRLQGLVRFAQGTGLLPHPA